MSRSHTGRSPPPSGLELVRDIMEDFARGTGLDPTSPSPRLYIWTDAFAVCNYLGLWEATGDSAWRELALRLVDQVHHVLGRHRADDEREGWISGLSEEEGEHHPTVRGLRIGKPLPEREAREAYDARREWDRDGQYYHHLTRWMQALARVWETTGDVRHLTWAIELADGAQRAFLTRTAAGRGLCWKVSIDGSRPLIGDFGQHDPLDGLLTVAMLASDVDAVDAHLGQRLRPIMTDLEELCVGGRWATDDPLGAGGLLVGVYRASKLAVTWPTIDRLLPRITRDAATSLEAAVARGGWRLPAEHRRAFRELGLSLGIRAADRAPLGKAPPSPRARSPYDPLVTALTRHYSQADVIERFWLDPRHRRSAGWRSHHDISAVMLAASLIPRGLLGE